MAIRIYHNPRCSKSRKTLELLRQNGISPTIVPYLEQPPAAATLQQLAKQLGRPLRELLRTQEEEFKSGGKLPDLNDEKKLAQWLHDHPRVLERPIVVDEAKNRAVVGRPPENVLDLIAS